MLVDSQNEHYTQLIQQYLKIDDITAGSAKEQYLLRYRGQLNGDSVEAYATLATALKPFNVMPLFRREKEQDVVLLVNGTINPTPSNPWINLGLFLATVVSVLYAGALYSYRG